MRTAQLAWLVGGWVCIHSVVAVAGEGSSLRGLKPPRVASDTNGLAAPADSEPGLTWRAGAVREDLAPRLSLYTGTLSTIRFTSRTAGYSTSVHRLFTPRSAATADVDPFNNAVPKYTLYSQFNHALSDEWGLGFGLRQSEYNFATSHLLSVSAERYFRNFRGAYTLYTSGTNGSSLASAHRIQVNYFYGERNTVGLAYTTGRDLDHLGTGAIGLPANDVRDLALSGRHWLSPNWALTYDVLSQEQGMLAARRQGLRLGVSRSF
jgi:YaiO family outer membrane protein